MDENYYPPFLINNFIRLHREKFHDDGFMTHSNWDYKKHLLVYSEKKDAYRLWTPDRKMIIGISTIEDVCFELIYILFNLVDHYPAYDHPLDETEKDEDARLELFLPFINSRLPKCSVHVCDSLFYKFGQAKGEGLDEVAIALFQEFNQEQKNLLLWALERLPTTWKSMLDSH